MTAWVDAGCHLQLDLDATVRGCRPDAQAERAHAAGVAWLVCVGTEPTSRQAPRAVAERYDDVYATVGLHPHDASRLGRDWDALVAFAGADRCRRDRRNRFRPPLRAFAPTTTKRSRSATTSSSPRPLDRPLMIHSRNAWDDTFRVLDDRGCSRPHRSSTASPADPTRPAPHSTRDCYLSFSGIISFTTADEIRAAAAFAPAERLLVETDSSVPRAGSAPRKAERTRVRAARRRGARRGPRRRPGNDRGADLHERCPRVRSRSVTPSQIQGLLDAHHLRPSKALGQHFLADNNMADHIVRLAGVRTGDHIVEVGPGLGSLTVALCDAGAHVRAVEIDRRLAAVLSDVVGDRTVDVVITDALKVDWPALLADHDRWTMVSNLPYNVAIPVVMRALETAPMIERFLVMVQREVGERLAAVPGTKAYGAVSVKVAYYASADVVGTVPPAVFVPKPKVDSALVRLERRPAPSAANQDPERMFELIRAGFATRRKMLRRALDATLDRPSGEHADRVFHRAGIDRGPSRNPHPGAMGGARARRIDRSCPRGPDSSRTPSSPCRCM